MRAFPSQKRPVLEALGLTLKHPAARIAGSKFIIAMPLLLRDITVRFRTVKLQKESAHFVLRAPLCHFDWVIQ
jgi:hypothetical protein